MDLLWQFLYGAPEPVLRFKSNREFLDFLEQAKQHDNGYNWVRAVESYDLSRLSFYTVRGIQTNHLDRLAYDAFTKSMYRHKAREVWTRAVAKSRHRNRNL